MIPAVCETCPTIFASGFMVENSTDITFSGFKSGSCPNCGGIGRIPDGTYNVFGDVLELLSGPSQTVEDLKRLSEILERARAQQALPEEVLAEIEDNDPKLKTISDLFPKTRNEFYMVVGLVIAAIALMTGSGSKKSHTEIMYNNVINHIYEKQRSAEPGKPSGTKKIGRNEPCPCKSGKKYKHCHGKLQ